MRAQRTGLIVAAEAGAGSLLAALVERALGSGELTAESRILGAPPAARFLRGCGLSLTVRESVDPGDVSGLLDELDPTVVWTGAGAGRTIEKVVTEVAAACRIPVHAYVDHYWNPWQRFADPRTGERWRWLPDTIFVPHRRSLDRMVAAGCPRERLRVFHHPLLLPGRIRRTPEERSAARRDLGLDDGSRAVLFVSEYGFPASPHWEWDQPPEQDIVALAQRLLKGAAASFDHGSALHRPVILVRPHPAEERDWAAICASYPGTCWRLVPTLDKAALLGASDVVFGLNSVLLLEAAVSGLRAYSYHESCRRPESWLSSLRPEVEELASPSAVRAVLLGSEQRAGHLPAMARSMSCQASPGAGRGE